MYYVETQTIYQSLILVLSYCGNDTCSRELTVVSRLYYRVFLFYKKSGILQFEIIFFP